MRVPRGGIERNYSPLVSWGPPPRNCLNFERFYVRFNGFLCIWVKISVVNGHNLLLEKKFLLA